MGVVAGDGMDFCHIYSLSAKIKGALYVNMHDFYTENMGRQLLISMVIIGRGWVVVNRSISAL